MRIIQVTLLIFLVSIIYSRKSSKIHGLNNILNEINSDELAILRQSHNRDALDVEAAKNKAEVIKTFRKKDTQLENGRDMPFGPEDAKGRVEGHYHMDAVLNGMRRSKGKKRSDSSSSSSLEMGFWKDEWNEIWLQKKFEALNSPPIPGDTVNMALARPWGVPCGDSNQHDMPWGTCMLPGECDAEYRIYRGDIFCGKSKFVCCSLVVTNYDLYQGLDQSFEGTSFATDSEEKKRENTAKEGKKEKKEKQRKKRVKDRERRKKRIRKTIRKIIKEITKIINKITRNATKSRKKKTKWLRKYIIHLKKQYKKDRHIIKNIHDEEMNITDHDVINKLEQVRGLNQNFFKNSTFRDIVVNGTVNDESLKLFAQANPGLLRYLAQSPSRRQMKPDFKDYLEYDIEYGNLYYR